MLSLKIDIVTLFPQFFSSPLQESLLSKAIEKGLIKIEPVDLRSFSLLPHRSVDDTPYGGGAGMVLRAEPLSAAVKELQSENSKVILLDPGGKKLTQKLAKSLSEEKHLILVCGRYEGVDQRFKDKYVDLELSIGDYVINGGETASLVVVEALSRLVPGVIGSPDSLEEESFTSGLLEYPAYTRPEVFENEKVPGVLLSGNHEKIRQWRREKALEKTKQERPDLLEN